MRFIFSKSKAGFTLAEVNMVMLIFGIAITALMSLFPVGLRQGSQATSDTIQCTFAEYVLNSIQANASEITDWSVWADEKTFRKEVIKGIKLDGKNLECHTGHDAKDKNGYSEIDKYLTGSSSPEGFIRYRLDIRRPISPSRDLKNRLYQITVWATDNRNGYPTDAPAYVTDVVYLGVTP